MATQDNTFTGISVGLTVALSLLTTSLNAMCIRLILKSRQMLKRNSSVLILNLLFIHLFQGLVVFPFYAAKKSDNTVMSPWLQRVVCDGFRFTYMTSFYASVMAVFSVTLDRFLATCFVLRYREIVTRRNVVLALIGQWIYVVTLCLLPFINNGDKTTPNVSNSNKTMGDSNTTVTLQIGNYITVTSETPNITALLNATLPPATSHMLRTSSMTSLSSQCGYNQMQLWTILMLTVNCAVPLALVIIFYSCILTSINVIQHRTERSRTCTKTSLMEYNNINPDRMPREKTKTLTLDREKSQLRQITRTCVIITTSYFLFWLPSVIYYVTFRACPGCFPTDWEANPNERYVAFFMKFLAFVDAVATPVIYCVMSKEFRRQVNKDREQRSIVDSQSIFTKVNYDNRLLRSSTTNNG